VDPEHIRAHFLTCCLALLIVRLSQRALPSPSSAQALLAEMRAGLLAQLPWGKQR
jgi:hypothetical protein